MYRRIRLRGPILAVLILLAGTAGATIIPRLSFETLTDSSELIVSGRIIRSWTAWDPERKYIWTHYELAASSFFKGSAGSAVEFAEPGGEVDGRVMLIGGAVAYSNGDQVLVFLSRMPNRYLRTTGWAQGKYQVDLAGRLHASAVIGESEYVAGRPSAGASALRSLEGVGLSELRQRIAARLASPGRVQ